MTGKISSALTNTHNVLVLVEGVLKEFDSMGVSNLLQKSLTHSFEKTHG